MVDALGSVVGTSNRDNTVSRRYQYKPYGTRLTASGSGADPRFQWVGTYGYRITSGLRTQYVRSRTLDIETSRWNSKDKLVDVLRSIGPGNVNPGLWAIIISNTYGYVSANPATLIDPLGYVGTSSEHGFHFPKVNPPKGSMTGCANFSWPFILPKPWTASIFGSTCLTCYDTHCCKPPATASKCLTMSVGASFGATIGWGDFLGIGDVKRTVGMVISTVTSIVGGGISAGISCGQPMPGCPSKQDEGHFKLCLNACFMFIKLGGCWTIGQTIDWGGTAGWCGTPSVTASLSYERKKCD